MPQNVTGVGGWEGGVGGESMISAPWSATFINAQTKIRTSRRGHWRAEVNTQHRMPEKKKTHTKEEQWCGDRCRRAHVDSCSLGPPDEELAEWKEGANVTVMNSIER